MSLWTKHPKLPLYQKNMFSEQRSKIEQLMRSGEWVSAARLCAALYNQHGADAALLAMKGIIHVRLGEFDKAAPAFREALELQPDNVETWHNLAVSCHRLGRLAQAADALKEVIRLQPGHSGPHFDLGKILLQLNRHEEAAGCFRQVVDLDAGNVDAYNHLGALLCMLGRLDEAVACFREAIRLCPDGAGAYNNLGLALKAQGQPDEAIAQYQKALALDPSSAETHNNLGVILADQGRLSEAEAAFQAALRLQPEYADACSHLGNIYLAQGRPGDAEASYRRAMSLQPGNGALHSKLLFSLNYSTRHSVDEIYQEHMRWGRSHGRIARAGEGYQQDRHPERRLKIGYVSPDFRAHSVAFFIETLLAQHDRREIEVFCYANIIRADATTRHLQSLADHWRDVYGMNDEQLAGKIRSDRIDILVDLAGHTGGNRLPVFAMRPAPIQATWLGYPNTTGLAAMDYRITDGIADPPGVSDPYYAEQLVRLPHGFLCYAPDEAAPLPDRARNMRGVTFASFNNLSKITPGVIALWSKILHAVENAKLLIKCKSMQDQATRESLERAFEKQGVSRQRLEIHGWMPTREAHLALYGKVDIALDPFPYNGTTTTCDALWMGVPVITLAGNSHAGRVGASLLSQLELQDCIAADEKAYVKIAKNLADDETAHKALSASLRERMKASPLCNSTAFARDMEDAYRTMWRTYCSSREQ